MVAGLSAVTATRSVDACNDYIDTGSIQKSYMISGGLPAYVSLEDFVSGFTSGFRLVDQDNNPVNGGLNLITVVDTYYVVDGYQTTKVALQVDVNGEIQDAVLC
jgi:hypothetical protein